MYRLQNLISVILFPLFLLLLRQVDDVPEHGEGDAGRGGVGVRAAGEGRVGDGRAAARGRAHLDPHHVHQARPGLRRRLAGRLQEQGNEREILP